MTPIAHRVALTGSVVLLLALAPFTRAQAGAPASAPSPSNTVVPAATPTAIPAPGSESSSASASVPAAARPGWIRRIERLVRGRAVSVSVGVDGRFLYRHRDGVPRRPASNEKLLLSMALLDAFGPDARLPTSAAASRVRGRTVRGNLWILGGGDPETGPGELGALARKVKAAGIRRIRGRVLGSRDFFKHDWFAPGWKPSFPGTEVALPTALSFEGNTVRGRSVTDPERLAAESLTKRLRAIGVHVRGKPGSGHAPRSLRQVASVGSLPLARLLRHQNVDSRNFYAETLGKLLGATEFGPPGTIRKGAAAIERFASSRGVKVTAHDNSGLSYDDRVTAAGILRLLWSVGPESWDDELRSSLPTGGQGTLKDRLRGVRVRAKTGTLTDVSALSGWVWMRRDHRWAQFSILDAGMSKTPASRIEDGIVRAVARKATCPGCAPAIEVP
jgi:serine-type D-Ala-D-Ala carboxypeptidase/endopeptidase (penicillin-binding protein 4)